MHNMTRTLKFINKTKLMLKLSQSRHIIRQLSLEISDEFGLFLKKKSGDWVAINLIAAELIKELLSEGIISRSESLLPLTSAGRVRIKRLLTNNQNICGQHQERSIQSIELDGRSLAVEVDLAESPLGWLYSRKDKNGERFIDLHELKAGERLRADYERGQLAPNVTRNWDHLAMPKDRQKNCSPLETSLSDSTYDARSRFEAALIEIGPELSGILVYICCEQRGLEEAERHLGFPKRSGKVILRIALSTLARHYGYLTATKPEKARRSKIFHWGTDDYRPQIDGS